MRVDIAQRFVLLREVREDCREDNVLQNVGVVTGVENRADSSAWLRGAVRQPRSIGSVASAVHSAREPSYTATFGVPSSVSASASLLAAMPAPQ